jgi:hypothetical protein
MTISDIEYLIGQLEDALAYSEAADYLLAEDMVEKVISQLEHHKNQQIRTITDK